MKNLLKYGIMVLAIVIASTGLLWADTCAVEVNVDSAKHDTTITALLDSSCINDTLADADLNEEQAEPHEAELTETTTPKRSNRVFSWASIVALSIPTILCVVLLWRYRNRKIKEPEIQKELKEKGKRRAYAKIINNIASQDDLTIIGAVVIVVSIIVISTFVLLLIIRGINTAWFSEISLSRLGLLGDFSSGIIGTLVAAVVAVYAIRTYRQERQTQKEASLMTTLSTMLELHKQNVAEIKIKSAEDPTKELQGRAAFKQMVEELKKLYSITIKAIENAVHDNPEVYAEWTDAYRQKQLAHALSYGYFFYSVESYNLTEKKESALYMLCEEVRSKVKSSKISKDKKNLQYHTFLGHYYRHLFNMVNYVDQHNFSQKYEKKEIFVKLIRSQLSDYEEILLYYNSLSTLGADWNNASDKTKIEKMGLIAKYRLLKNCPYYIEYFGIHPRELYKAEIAVWKKMKQQFFETDPEGQEEVLKRLLNLNTMNDYFTKAGVINLERLLSDIRYVSGEEGLYEKLEEKTIQLIKGSGYSCIYLNVADVPTGEEVAKSIAGILYNCTKDGYHVELVWADQNLINLVTQEIRRVDVENTPIRTEGREVSMGNVVNIQ